MDEVTGRGGNPRLPGERGPGDGGLTDRFDPESWAQLYQRPPRDADARAFREGADRALAACLRHSAAGQRWLDLGCGPGALAEGLRAAGLRPVGLDHDTRMLGLAAQVSAGARSDFVTASVARLPVRSGSVHGACAVSVIGCLVQPAAMLAECARVLAPDGRVVVTFSNRLGWAGRLRRFLGPPRSALARGRFRAYSGPEALGMFRDAGFEILECTYYNDVAFGGARALLRGMARNFMLVARRP